MQHTLHLNENDVAVILPNHGTFHTSLVAVESFDRPEWTKAKLATAIANAYSDSDTATYRHKSYWARCFQTWQLRIVAAALTNPRS